MLSRASLLPALAAAATLLVTGILPAPPARAAVRTAAESSPLDVAIDTLTPSAVPARGPVEITGTVTNTSEEEWRVVKVYALTSAYPITSTDELAEASRTDPDVQVGERITEDGTYDVLDALEPGESAAYSLRLRRDQLAIGTTPGVYWLGVHALGETDAGRDTLADGKTRTFWPLVGGDTGRIDTALVLPVRHEVRYAEDGSLEDVAGWISDLRPDGRLADLTDFGAAAGDRRLTWLVDPAVSDAVASLAAGNPPRFLGRTVETDTDESPSASAGPEQDASPSAEPSGDGEAEATPEEQMAAALGAGWLEATRQAMAGDQTLVLPYGDLDVAGADASDPDMVGLARQRSGRSVPGLAERAGPAVVPPSGYLPTSSLTLFPRASTVVVSDRALGGGTAALAELGGHRLLVSASGALAGGPGPGERFSPVAVRQRLLSEAALRLLAGQDAMVVVFPPGWNPPSTRVESEELFAGLDVPWLRLTTTRRIALRTTGVAQTELLDYPTHQERSELDDHQFAGARALMEAGRRLDSLLPANDTVAQQVSDEALTGVSYWTRRSPATSLARTIRSTASIQRELASVSIRPPASVTLSSDTGKFSATVTNGLAEPVRVRVFARTDPQLVIPPSDMIDLGPGERATVLMQAHSSLLGVHRVELVIADEEGRQVGGSASFPLRAAEVSDVIWVVVGVGVAMLVVAIGFRLTRRIRAARAGRSAP